MAYMPGICKEDGSTHYIQCDIEGKAIISQESIGLVADAVMSRIRKEIIDVYLDPKDE